MHLWSSANSFFSESRCSLYIFSFFQNCFLKCLQIFLREQVNAKVEFSDVAVRMGQRTEFPGRRLAHRFRFRATRVLAGMQEVGPLTG